MLYPELMLNFHIPQLRLYMQSKNEPGVAEESTTSHSLINDILQKVLKLCTACVWKIAFFHRGCLEAWSWRTISLVTAIFNEPAGKTLFLQRGHRLLFSVRKGSMHPGSKMWPHGNSRTIDVPAMKSSRQIAHVVCVWLNRN